MLFKSAVLCACVVFIASAGEPGERTPDAPCPNWIQKHPDQAVDSWSGFARDDAHLVEAVRRLSGMLDRKDLLDSLCAGLAMTDMAALLSISGRLAEAEAMAERAVRTLEETGVPDDLKLLRALNILASVRFQLGKMVQARQTFRRMQSIPIQRPEDRAIVGAMAAAMLVAERKWPQAESQYAIAIESLANAGHADTADAAALLNALGVVYINERRLSDADRTLNQALAIFERAPDASPWDRIKLLQTRGALRARQGDWREAEQDLARALSIADRESNVEPMSIRPLLISYAAVLRKNHRRREARSIETRLSGLGRVPEANGLVDVTDLLAKPGNRR
jgi:tetratricopeptide (TPR) repeat protein